jgi:hypothetical protein
MSLQIHADIHIHIQICIRVHTYAYIYDRISLHQYSTVGEILEWTGFAVACWSLPAAAFAFYTFCNLGPRAQKVRRYMCMNIHDLIYSSIDLCTHVYTLKLERRSYSKSLRKKLKTVISSRFCI